ncbi:MAG: hypothetical protein K2X47_11075 [Bdellovibrionales bacterium]|nr:hypothetical protein [Bdellovibrionales bacterium]
MKLNLVLILFIMSFVSPVLSAVTHPLSFDVWKAKKVAQARADYGRIKTRLAWVKRPLSHSQERALRNAKLNLEIAKSLSANEYFIVYLTEKFPKDSKALNAVTRKMTAKDISEILVEYQRLILQGGESPRYEPMHSYQGFDRSSSVLPASKSR